MNNYLLALALVILTPVLLVCGFIAHDDPGDLKPLVAPVSDLSCKAFIQDLDRIIEEQNRVLAAIRQQQANLIFEETKRVTQNPTVYGSGNAIIEWSSRPQQ